LGIVRVGVELERENGAEEKKRGERKSKSRERKESDFEVGEERPSLL